MRKRVSAYTLLELLVASAIFAGMIIGAVATLTASASLRTQEQSTYAVTQYVHSMMRQIAQDIRNSPAVGLTTETGSHYIGMAVYNTDAYGHQFATTSTRTYCTSAVRADGTGGVLHVYTNPSVLSCPSSGDTNTTGYQVTLTASRAMLPDGNNFLVGAIRVTLSAVGTIGSDERAKASAPSYTETETIPYLPVIKGYAAGQ